MFLRSFGLIVSLATLLVAAAPVDAASGDVCTRRFRAYDRAVLMFSSPGQENLVVSRNVGTVGQRLFDAGCVTRERDLSGVGVAVGAIEGDGGPAIRPVSLHVGIVPGIVMEAQMRTFFGDLGYRVSSIGAPGLGRRIYLGPFATEAALVEATEVARLVGFVAPYPRRFGP